nr:CMF_HP1_G0006680.mRNA.1.CDS.1 [Saccharomyces cerevisiae]
MSENPSYLYSLTLKMSSIATFSNARDSYEENKSPSMDQMNYARNTSYQESPGLQERPKNEKISLP